MNAVTDVVPETSKPSETPPLKQERPPVEKKFSEERARNNGYAQEIMTSFGKLAKDSSGVDLSTEKQELDQLKIELDQTDSQAEQQLRGEAVAEKPRVITAEDIPGKSYHIYRKSELTKARALTQQDFDSRGGVIKTLEGEESFKPGDFLAVGVKGEEYPIRKETMKSTKRAVGESDGNGWTNYETTTAVRAAKVESPFGVRRVGTEEIVYGKGGDYFVDSGRRQFIVDSEIFTKTYKEIPPEIDQARTQNEIGKETQTEEHLVEEAQKKAAVPLEVRGHEIEENLGTYYHVSPHDFDKFEIGRLTTRHSPFSVTASAIRSSAAFFTKDPNLLDQAAVSRGVVIPEGTVEGQKVSTINQVGTEKMIRYAAEITAKHVLDATSENDEEIVSALEGAIRKAQEIGIEVSPDTEYYIQSYRRILEVRKSQENEIEKNYPKGSPLRQSIDKPLKEKRTELSKLLDDSSIVQGLRENGIDAIKFNDLDNGEAIAVFDSSQIHNLRKVSA